MKVHQMTLRKRDATAGLYKNEKIIQSSENKSRRVRKSGSPRIPRFLTEFAKLLGSAIVRNLKATGISGRHGSVQISKEAFDYLKSNLNLQKKVWSPAQQILDEFSIDKIIFRNGDPEDQIECLDLQLKLGYEIRNEYFGKNSNGNIVRKSFNEKQNVHFKFERNVPLNTNSDDSLAQAVERQNAVNGID
jgi:hypothetical protein